MATKIEVEVEVKSNAEKMWKNIRESTTVFPKALPHLYEGIEVVEGDGKSVGSIRLIKHPSGLSAIKEKIQLVDQENKILSSVIEEEGDTLNYYKTFKASVSVTPKGSDGSSVKWWCEFDKTTDQSPNPELMRDFAVKTFQGLDAFILANPA